MADPRIDKLANVLVNYSVAVQPGDKVLIRGGVLGEPLLKAVYARVLQAGGHPLLMAELPGSDELFYRLASEDQLKFVPDVMKYVIETYDVSIGIRAAGNTKEMSTVDPAKMVMANQAQIGIMQTYMERAARGELRWVGTLFPTQAYAQDAEVSLSEYEDFVYGACLPDLDDPVGYWKRFSAWQQGIVDWFKGKEQVHVIGPDTDLRLSIAGRSFVNCDGKENMPDGEVFTGPVENSVEGTVRFSYPSIYRGREVTDIHLEFQEGKVVNASAAKNEDFLLKTIDTDPGARYVGEFAIGTNKGIDRFTGQILFDEKIDGSFHMALGRGFPESGSQNKSAIHWDMVCDLRQGGEIRVDGELLYQNGAFVVQF